LSLLVSTTHTVSTKKKLLDVAATVVPTFPPSFDSTTIEQWTESQYLEAAVRVVWRGLVQRADEGCDAHWKIECSECRTTCLGRAKGSDVVDENSRRGRALSTTTSVPKCSTTYTRYLYSSRG
jgi:hypothetical protein